MVPPCLSTDRLLSAVRLLGSAALAGVSVGLVVQTAAATYVRLQGDCTVGWAIQGGLCEDPWSCACKDAFSFFGGVQVERLVMVTLASTGIVLALARMIICAWGLLRALRRRCNARFAARPVELLWRAVVVFLGRGEEARIWRQANKQRVRQARACLHMVGLGVLPATLFSSLAVFSPKATRPQPDRGFVLQFLFNSEAIPMLLLAILGAIVDASPSFTTPTKLNYINIFCSIFWSWKYMVMSEGYYLHNHTWMLVVRAVQGIVCGNARLTIFLQGTITGVEVAAVAITHDAGPRMYWTISRDVFTFLLISILCWTFEQCQLAEARATLRSFRSDRAAQLVQRLLSGMCEAVVKLDGQLCMVEPSPKLSSLLLRQGPLAPGLHFTDLMPAEDAERVRLRLEAEAEEQAMAEMDEGSEQERTSSGQRPAQMLHLHLNDGTGSKLPVELFYSCLPDVDGQPSFLVGIKEDSEGQAPLEERVEALPEFTLHQTSELVRLAMLPENSRTDCQSHSSWSLSEEGGVLQVCLDAETPELRVLSVSGAFALLGGAAGPCSQLQDWLSAEDFGRLSAWLAFVQPDSPIPGCAVKLQPPTCKGCYQVYCTLLRVVPASIPHAGGKPVCVLFEHPIFKPWLSRTAEGEAVDRVMSQHRQRAAGMGVEARGSGATSSASSSTVRSNSKREDWILLWFTVCSQRLKILSVKGEVTSHRGKFARKQPFRDWLERPDEFVEILKRALVDHEVGVHTDLPRKLGRFVLTQPGTEVDRCRFIAKVYLVEISDDESAGYPCCVGVKPLRDLPLLAASDPQPGSEIVLSL